jgi:hypothetical protein
MTCLHEAALLLGAAILAVAIDQADLFARDAAPSRGNTGGGHH